MGRVDLLLASWFGLRCLMRSCPHKIVDEIRPGLWIGCVNCRYVSQIATHEDLMRQSEGK